MALSAEPLLPCNKSSSGRGGERKCIGILGTGDYARALAKRLLFSGYDVIMGSRSPATRQLSGFDDCLCGVQMMSLDHCIGECDLLVVAIHMENFKTTLAPRAELLADKVVIDVSNRTNRYSASSNAEFLQSLLPATTVVKAFNSISAHCLEDQTTVSSSRVFVASDDVSARERVLDLARDLGFTPCDMGGLRGARTMEAFVLKVFPGWKVPLFFTFGVFNLWALYCVYIYFIDTTAYRWDQIFLKVLNKPLCMTAMTVLTLTYLGGSVAGLVQLHRGSKYRRFPRWLNAWLVARRQLGLIALALVLLHAAASCMMLSPTYYSSWFQKPSVIIPANITQQTVVHLQPAWMVWKGELACLLGLAALLLLCLVGVASLPSVSAALNWAEWQLVQSRIGILALTLALGHVVAMGAPGWAKGGWGKSFRSITFLSGFLPALTLLLRIVLACPPLSRRLKKIRRGWESPGCVARCGGNSGSASNEDSSSIEAKKCCSSQKGILKTTSCGSASASNGSAKVGRMSSASSVKQAYTAINFGGMEEDGEEGCSSCQEGKPHPSMPTRSCDCSSV